MTSAVSAPGSALVLGASTSTMTSMATISLASSSGPIPIVIGPLAIHVDRPVVFGLVGGRLMPTSKVMERALARGVVLTGTGPAVVWVPGVHGAVEFVRVIMEERDPLVICITVSG